MRRGVLFLRGGVAVGAGVLTVLVLVFGTILLFIPQWTRPGGFPATGPALAGLLLIEVLAGVAGAFVAAFLAPRAPAVHGAVLGALVLLLHAVTAFDPASPWPLGPAVLLVAFVPPQTWLVIAFAARLRSNAAPRRPGAAAAVPAAPPLSSRRGEKPS
jgi:hypothetical protein